MGSLVMALAQGQYSHGYENPSRSWSCSTEVGPRHSVG